MKAPLHRNVSMSTRKTGAQIGADAWQKRVDIARSHLKTYAFWASIRELNAQEIKAQAKTVAKLAALMAEDPYAEV